MTVDEVLRRLDSLGEPSRRTSEQVAADRCATEGEGVDVLAEEIGCDQALAYALWKTGVDEARLVAARVSDAETMGPGVLTAWLKSARTDDQREAVTALAARSEAASVLMEHWIGSRNPLIRAAGWGLLGRAVAGAARFQVDAAACEAILGRIESAWGEEGPDVRRELATTAAAIGARDSRYTRRAEGLVARAKRSDERPD